MRRSAFPGLGLASSLILFALVVSGCFQASGAGLPPTQTGNAPIVSPTSTIDAALLEQQATFLYLTQLALLPSPTANVVAQAVTLPPSMTPSDTPMPPTETPVPPSPTATDTATNTPVPPSPTNTALPPTATVTTQSAKLNVATRTPVKNVVVPLPTMVVAQVATDATQAAIFAQATNIIQTVTQAAAFVNATQTASAGGAVVPPTDVPINPTPVPGQVTTPVPQAPLGASDGSTGSITPDGHYTVVAGDRLFRIGLRFNMTYQYLAQVNGIVNPNLILPGEVLVIPGYNGTGVPATPIPAGGPTATPGTSPNSGQTYVVQAGDTMFSIALRNSVSLTALAQKNNIANVNLIYVGQQLIIP